MTYPRKTVGAAASVLGLASEGGVAWACTGPGDPGYPTTSSTTTTATTGTTTTTPTTTTSATSAAPARRRLSASR